MVGESRSGVRLGGSAYRRARGRTVGIPDGPRKQPGRQAQNAETAWVMLFTVLAMMSVKTSWPSMKPHTAMTAKRGRRSARRRGRGPSGP